MTVSDIMVLPPDVVVVPINELPEKVLVDVEHDADDWAVTRPRSRTPTRIVNSELASLLLLFREELTIVEAVIEIAKQTSGDPERILEEAFPALQRFMNAKWLVPASGMGANAIEQTLAAGDSVAGFEVITCIQVLEDTEVYQARDKTNRLVALKMIRPDASARVERMFHREAKILRLLNGEASPAFLENGEYEGQKYLAIEWHPGVPVTTAAAEYRQGRGLEAQSKLRELCCSVLDVYASLHEKQIVHADVHPRNVLVDGEGNVSLVDFGLARVLKGESELADFSRGGIADFHDPEFADARRRCRRPPRATRAGEQYSLAALLYLLFTGKNYLDFSVEKPEMLRQIVEDNPLPFSRRGVAPWPEVELVLSKALSKNPKDRFRSIADFAKALAGTKFPHGDVAPPHRIEKDTFQSLVDTTLLRLRPEGRLFNDGLNEGPVASLTYGAAGIAYALYRIACLREDPNLLSLADLWATRAESEAGSENAFCCQDLEITEEIVGQVSPYNTASGVYAVQALIAHARGDFPSMVEAVMRFNEESHRSCENLDLTLGRSSTLVGCSIILEAMNGIPLVTGLEAERREAVLDLGNQTLTGIWERARTLPPLTECKELDYTGIAHGWAGLCYAALMWCDISGTAVPTNIETRLDHLAELAEPCGRGVRWPVRLRTDRRGRVHDYMASWCNGAPGHVHLWTAAYRRYRESRYWELAEKAGWNAWEDGGADGSICCGYAGRSYALLNLYKHTQDSTWLKRAHQLCAHATQVSKSHTMMSNSLYKGELGVALLAADLNNPENACQPFFELGDRL